MDIEKKADLQQEYEQLRAVALGVWGGTKDLPASPPNLRRFRDLTLVSLLGDLHLVIACDSNASIGEKPNDGLAKPYAEVGISALKVPMMEVLAAGAVPLLIVNALCMEMDPSGRKLIETMSGELVRYGFDPNMMLTGSTEDNVLTLQSGIGITVIGLASEEKLRLGQTQLNDVVLCAGNPKSGVAIPYVEGEPDIASISTVQSLNEISAIHEILPVGSKGVVYEANELANTVGFNFRLADVPPAINLDQSAGASTAVLVAISASHVSSVADAVSVPVYDIGTIE
jgi:selenophosphate synthetase-related protein